MFRGLSAKQLLLLYAAPLLLTVVAGVQRYLAVAHDLNPIKGGGFGMFAGHNTNLLRCVTLYVIGSDGKKLPVPGESIQGPYARRLSEIRVLPIRGRIKVLAEELANEQWAAIRGAQGAPPMITKYIREGSRIASYPLIPLKINGVEIVLWQYDLESDAAQLRRQILVRQYASSTEAQ